MNGFAMSDWMDPPSRSFTFLRNKPFLRGKTGDSYHSDPSICPSVQHAIFRSFIPRIIKLFWWLPVAKVWTWRRGMPDVCVCVSLSQYHWKIKHFHTGGAIFVLASWGGYTQGNISLEYTILSYIVGGNFNLSTSKKLKSTWIIFPQKKLR